MEPYVKKIEIRWADLDPNFHVLHSKYYDFGAFCRMAFLTENGINAAVMQQHHFGPIIFREECFFKKEIAFGDEIHISLSLLRMNADQSRWSMGHEIWKNKNMLAAIIHIDGAWMDTIKRKLTVLPEGFNHILEKIPKSPDFAIN